MNAGNWSYGQLFEDGHLAICAYIQPPFIPATLEEMVRDYPAGPGKTISFERLHSRQELIEAFSRNTVVFYFGHANYGRGIVFEPFTNEQPIPMGRDTLLVPGNHLTPSDNVLEHLDNGFVRIQGGSHGLRELNVRCRVFGYFGCRTDFHFRDVWRANFPQVDFLATTYVTHSIKMAPGILQAWIAGLQQGRTLAEIVEDMNRDRSAAILFGRMTEVSRYHNPDHHPDCLFTY